MSKKPKSGNGVRVESFDFAPGSTLARKYEIISRLGSGWEGEVYRIRERSTKVERAAKLFFPHRNPKNRVSTRYAQKLNKLRHCHIVIQYHTEEQIQFRRVPITVLVSEYVEGDLLSEFISRQPGKRLHPFQGLLLLHALAKGIECIHHHREYHGDLHSENVIVSRCGISFDLKLLDFFHWAAPKKENIQDDIIAVIRIFYDAIGGAKFYAKHPQVVKEICCGLKRSLILKRFPSARHLREHLEGLRWD